MIGLSFSTVSTYSRSLLLLLATLDILAAWLSLYLVNLKVDSTLYISMLLWFIIAYLSQSYEGKNYTHIRSIISHHLLAVFGHAFACLMLSILYVTWVIFTPALLGGIALFWLISLSFKYGLCLAYLFIRNRSLSNKRYLVIGHNAQAHALRRFLRRQYGELYYYTGTLAEPRTEADLQEIATYCIRNDVHTLYYAGSEGNPFILPLYQLANWYYMYFHYVLEHNESEDYRWQWNEVNSSLPTLSCSPRKEMRWKRKKPGRKTKLNIYPSS